MPHPFAKLSEADERTFLAVICPDCGGYSERLLIWLSTATDTSCDCCGAMISLVAGENRHLIDDVVSRCQRVTLEAESL
jgi:ribosomal protein S27E